MHIRREKQCPIYKFLLFFLFMLLLSIWVFIAFFVSTSCSDAFDGSSPSTTQSQLFRTSNICFLNVSFSCSPMWFILSWIVFSTKKLVCSKFWVIPLATFMSWFMGFHPVGLSVPILCFMALPNILFSCSEKSSPFLNFWSNHCSSVLWAPSVYLHAFLFTSCRQISHFLDCNLPETTLEFLYF